MRYHILEQVFVPPNHNGAGEIPNHDPDTVHALDDTPISVPRVKRRRADTMKRCALLSALIALIAIGVAAGRGEQLVAEAARPYPADLLGRVRGAAAIIPGALPARINYVKFAESHRPLADIIDGGSQADYESARTAFQVMYPAGSAVRS
jgi:hypothetical protein